MLEGWGCREEDYFWDTRPEEENKIDYLDLSFAKRIAFLTA